ncbi:MAG: hypothetical protein JSR48_00810 [Verrucomicrobia bacterium]|nr:hypothetical protein [Verrucomicrobiota bacterium]
MTTPLAIRTTLWCWLIAALVASRLALLQRVPMPAVQAILFGLVVLQVVAYRIWPAWRAWADGLPLRLVVGLHLTRLVGFYFLYLHERDRLPYAFAVPGGIGDILVATLALAVIAAPLSPKARLHAISIWNVVGLLDILMVVATAARLGLADPRSMRELTFLPLSLLPTFLVPLIIASHLLLYVRTRRALATAE